MFLAIINDTYSIVKSEITHGQGQLAKDFDYLLGLLKKYVFKKRRSKAFDALDHKWLQQVNDVKPKTVRILLDDERPEETEEMNEDTGKKAYEDSMDVIGEEYGDGRSKDTNNAKTGKDSDSNKSDSEWTESDDMSSGPLKKHRSSLQLSGLLKE